MTTPDKFGQAIFNDEYHDRPNMSASKIKQFMKSPAHFKASQEVKLESPALRFGSMAHTYCLEHDIFNTQYGLFDGDRRTKQGKADWERIQTEGLEPYKSQELDTLNGMRKAVKDLIPPGHTELSFFAELRDVPCQCRPDRITDDWQVYDLKTIADIEDVDRAFYKFGYHIQAYFYFAVLDAIAPVGIDIPEMVFVFVEKQPPYDTAIRTIDPDVWQATGLAVDKALEDFKQATSSDVWPGIEPDKTPKIAPCPEYIKSKLLPDVDIDAMFS